MSYTKGPWTIDRDDQGGQMYVATETEYLLTIHRHIPEYEANAALIAAAPELVEALESALVSTINGNAIPEKVREGMIAAITKANGGRT